MEQAQETQEEFQPSEAAPTEYKVTLLAPFRQEYQRTRERFGDQIGDRIKSLLQYREQRTYHLLVGERPDYFASMWQFLQRQLNLLSPHDEADLLTRFEQREGAVMQDIAQNRLEIENHRIRPQQSQQQAKQRKLGLLRDQSSQIQRKLMDINESINEIPRDGESRAKMFQIKQEKIKQYEEFMKKQKKDRQERAKLAEQQRKRQEEVKAKKEELQRAEREKQMKERKEELLKKAKESQQRRSKDRQQRQQRQKDYRFISKSAAQQPPLFKKLEQDFHNRYEQFEYEKRKKAVTERQSLFEAIDNKNLEEHEKKYEQMRAERERQRKERMQQQERMVELQEEEQARYGGNYQPSSAPSDPREEERKIALEKKQKVRRYIQETVKERYLPRIDEEKRRQFLKLIQEMGRKRLKKVKKQDGSFEYEQVKPGDPKMIGLQYLQKTKEMAAKMRGKRKNSDHLPDPEPEKPRVFDYLAERRKKGSSKSHRDRLEFVGRRDLSFDDKLKKVERESQKLEQLAKQKEMRLKFGKFATSEQILQHKQEIDQHYIDIINMKLRLINAPAKEE